MLSPLPEEEKAPRVILCLPARLATVKRSISYLLSGMNIWKDWLPGNLELLEIIIQL